MILKSSIISFTLLATLQLGIWTPLNAATYNVSDIALTPGQDMSKLNIAWHHSDDECNCVVEIVEKPDKNKSGYGTGAEFPEDSYEFHGANEFIGLDENSVVTYACEVTVSGLESLKDYAYRLGNDKGEWSNIYEYATRDKNGYGFFYVADSQIGASGRNKSPQEIKAYIAEYQIRKRYPDLHDERIKALVDACINNSLSDTYIGLTELEETIDLFYSTFFEDTTDRLLKLSAIDPDLSKEILAFQMAAAKEDSKGWVKTVGKMTKLFPEAAFILSGGDQVDFTNREYEYTGFFSPPELTSLPVAPVVGNHDGAVNFNYHFNLPNESSEYGVSEAGGDYYFNYGDVLFMVLNIDVTTSAFPRNPPPPPPDQKKGETTSASPQQPAPPPDGGAGVDSKEDFLLALSELENSCEEETGKCYDKIEKFKESIAEHEMFMKDVIVANPNARWKIVMWHDSIYSVGYHATEDVIRALRHYMVPVLDALDIDVVLMGHDHCFTRTYQMLDDDPQIEQKVDQKGRVVNPTGTLYLTANSSSGSKYYELNKKFDVVDDPDTPVIEGPDPYFEYVSAAGQLKKPQFSYIVVDHNSLEISTYRTDTMESIDNYAIVKE